MARFNRYKFRAGAPTNQSLFAVLITKTPVRISLGAGETDLPAYYQRYGARFATSAGSKFVYVMVNPHPDKIVWMGMANAERVDSPDQLRHKVVRNVLRWMDITRNIEIVSISEIPTNSGLGGSSSFIVGLLKALHAYKGEYPWPTEIAEEACYVERKLLREYAGKQDAYAASLGGILWMEISKRGRVNAVRLKLNDEFTSNLTDSIAFIYSGLERESSQIQTSHRIALEGGSSELTENLRKIARIAEGIRRALEHQDTIRFGELMNDHWACKRKLSGEMTNRTIDGLYELGRRSGAIGGNLMGAGGGGHFMFVCKDKMAKARLTKRFAAEGLREVDMRFEMVGSTLTKLT